MANGETHIPARLSVPVIVSIVGIITAGFSAWYGMSTRLSLVESKFESLTTRIDTVSATSDRTDQSVTARIDRVIEDVQTHMRSPAHAIGERIAADLERRVAVLEHRLDDLQRAEAQKGERR